MSKLKSLLPLFISLFLVGCTKNTPTTEATTEETLTNEVSESEESLTSEESSEEIVYTAEMVATDIGTALGVTLTNKETYYGGAFNFSQEGVDYSNTQAEEEVLKPVVTTLKSFMPEYLTLVGEKYFTSEEDFWGDSSGDTAYYALLGVNEVQVELISYCYNNSLIGQISVH